MYQKPVIVLVGFLVAGGCENPWQTGTWVEEGFASTDDSCQASIVTEPAEPYRYTMGEMTDWDDWPESNDLTSTQEWIQSRSDNFWKYCQTSGSAVLFDCPVAIQLVDPDLPFASQFTKMCGAAADIRIESNSYGILMREGEAFVNHRFEVYCAGQGDTGSSGDDTGVYDQTCRSTYSSWLKRQ